MRRSRKFEHSHPLRHTSGSDDFHCHVPRTAEDLQLSDARETPTCELSGGCPSGAKPTKMAGNKSIQPRRHQKDVHINARTTLRSREGVVRFVLVEKQTLKAAAAAFSVCSKPVRQWVSRLEASDVAGLW